MIALGADRWKGDEALREALQEVERLRQRAARAVQENAALLDAMAAASRVPAADTAVRAFLASAAAAVGAEAAVVLWAHKRSDDCMIGYATDPALCGPRPPRLRGLLGKARRPPDLVATGWFAEDPADLRQPGLQPPRRAPRRRGAGPHLPPAGRRCARARAPAAHRGRAAPRPVPSAQPAQGRHAVLERARPRPGARGKPQRALSRGHAAGCHHGGGGEDRAGDVECAAVRHRSPQRHLVLGVRCRPALHLHLRSGGTHPRNTP